MRLIRRTLARWITLLALALAVMALTGVLAGLGSHLSRAEAVADRRILTDATIDGQAVSFRTTLATAPAAQDAAADSLLRRVFDSLPVVTYRSETAAPLQLAGRSSGATLGLRAYEHFLDHSRVVAGSWPSAGSPVVAVALPVSVARSLGVHLDDRLTLNGTTATAARVAAIFVPLSPDDPYFFAGDSGTFDPDSAVSGGDLARLTGSVSVQWTIGVDVADLLPGEVGRLRMAVDALQQAVDDDVGVNSAGIQFYGDLSDTLSAVAAGNAALETVRPLPVLLIGTVGCTVLLVLVTLLTGQRRTETTVLRARGAGVPATAGVAAAEMAVVAAAAAAAGTGIAALVQPPAGGGSPGTSWWPAILAVTAAVCAVIVTTLRQAFARGPLADRRRAVLTLGPVVLIVLAAAFSLQRFRNLGSATSSDRNHAVSVDPVAIGAPALTLVALALVGVALVGAVARPIAAAAATGKGLWLGLAVHQFDRRFPVFGIIALVIGIAVAGATVSGGFARTWDAYRQVSRQLADPTDIRVALPQVTDVGFGRADLDVGYRGLPGVSEADDVLLTDTQVGTTSIRLTTIPATRTDVLMPDVPGGFDPTAARESLTGAPVGIPIPTGDDHLTASVTVAASAAPPTGTSAPAPTQMGFVLWIAGPQGTVIPIDLGSVTLTFPAARTGGGPMTATAVRTARVSIPTGAAAGWRVVGLDSLPANSDVDTGFRVSLAGLIGDGAALSTEVGRQWSVQPIQDGSRSDLSGATAPDIGWSGMVPAGAGSSPIRLMPATATVPGNSGAGAVVPVPVVVDTQVAAGLGLEVGSTLDLQLTATDRHLQAVVAVISPLLPGSPGEPGVLADTGSVLLQLLRTSPVVPASNQVWIRATSVQMAADAVRAVAGGAEVIVTPDDPSSTLIRPAVSAFWFASGVALLLSLLCLLAVGASFVAARRPEVVVLRAVGLSRTGTTWSRGVEFLGAVGAGVVIGLVAGRLTAQATVVGLAHSAVVRSSTLAPHLTFAAEAWWTVLATAAVAFVVIFCHAVAVHRQYGPYGTGSVQR